MALSRELVMELVRWIDRVWEILVECELRRYHGFLLWKRFQPYRRSGFIGGNDQLPVFRHFLSYRARGKNPSPRFISLYRPGENQRVRRVADLNRKRPPPVGPDCFSQSGTCRREVSVE